MHCKGHRRILTAGLTWLLACAGVALAGNAAAEDVVLPCKSFIDGPLDGSTAVHVDTAITGRSTCTPDKPAFTDDTGAEVPAEFVFTPNAGGADFTLTPIAPLQPDRIYTVLFSNHITKCDSPSGKATFTTGPKPGVRAVWHDGYQGELSYVAVSLTEPVMNPNDLAVGSGFVSIAVSGVEPAGNEGPIQDGTKVDVTFKPLATQPRMTDTVAVKLHKGLAFASGAVLSEDVDVSYVPADLPWGWYVTGSPTPCEAADSSGCQASRAPVNGSAAALWGIGITLMLGAMRRRTRAAGAG
jgi:hypothetical protein